MNQFKKVINFDNRHDLEEAFSKGELSTDSLIRVLEDDTFYRLDPSGKGFIEIQDPDAEENSNIMIWWQDKIHVRWNNMLREKAQSAEVRVPVLPGAISMALDSIGTDTRFEGQMIVPLPLRHSFDPDVVNDVVDSQSLKNILMNQFVGIPFEICHYDKIKHYGGIITTLDLREPDLCLMRDRLSI